MKVLVETSARHVHVTQEHLEALFGKGFELTVKKELSQPGQFASNERVTEKRIGERVHPRPGSQCFPGRAEPDRCTQHRHCRSGS